MVDPEIDPEIDLEIDLKIYLIIPGNRAESPWERCLFIGTKDVEDKFVWLDTNVILFGLKRRSSSTHPPPIQ